MYDPINLNVELTLPFVIRIQHLNIHFTLNLAIKLTAILIHCLILNYLKLQSKNDDKEIVFFLNIFC